MKNIIICYSFVACQLVKWTRRACNVDVSSVLNKKTESTNIILFILNFKVQNTIMLRRGDVTISPHKYSELKNKIEVVLRPAL